MPGLAGNNAAKQISMLLYCLGEQSKAIFDLTDITAEEKEVTSSSFIGVTRVTCG